jgi:hypothetical protein
MCLSRTFNLKLNSQIPIKSKVKASIKALLVSFSLSLNYFISFEGRKQKKLFTQPSRERGWKKSFVRARIFRLSTHKRKFNEKSFVGKRNSFSFNLISFLVLFLADFILFFIRDIAQSCGHRIEFWLKLKICSLDFE